MSFRNPNRKKLKKDEKLSPGTGGVSTDMGHSDRYGWQNSRVLPSTPRHGHVATDMSQVD